MKRLTAIFLWLAVLTICGPTKAAEEIAQVKDIAQLRALKPIRLKDGTDIRLGIGDGGRDADPWKLIYCLVKNAESKNGTQISISGKISGEILGPVFYDCVAANDDRERGRPKVEIEIKMDDVAPRAEEDLFCGLILLAHKGVHLTQVMVQDGTVLQEMKFTVATEPACFWQNFADEQQFLAGKDNTSGTCVDRDTFAVHPRFDGTYPIFRINENTNPAQFPDTGVRNKDRGNFLPGAISLKGCEFFQKVATAPHKVSRKFYPLHLSLNGDAFVIESVVPMMDMFDDTLLARWWVNGKPIAAKRTNEFRQKARGRLVDFIKTAKVAFDLPKCLGKVKVGDKVKLQVLYSLDGYTPIPLGHRDGVDAARCETPWENNMTPPLLSNPLEFTITKELFSFVGRTEKVPTATLNEWKSK